MRARLEPELIPAGNRFRQKPISEKVYRLPAPRRRILAENQGARSFFPPLALRSRVAGFVAVGSSEEIKGLVGKKTRTYDARQMTIVPGFIDTHNHGRGEGLLYNVLVGNPYDVEFVTIQSTVDKLRARARTTPPGTWVEGYFFDDTKLKDNRPLNAQDLDKVSTEHPVVIIAAATPGFITAGLLLPGVTIKPWNARSGALV